jgi:hypothetical protein
MKPDRSAYFPLGLALGLGVGAIFGNPALGALIGMVTGLVISTTGRKHSSNFYSSFTEPLAVQAGSARDNPVAPRPVPYRFGPRFHR